MMHVEYLPQHSARESHGIHVSSLPLCLMEHGGDGNPSTHLLFKKPSAESFLGSDYQLFFS